MTAQRDHGARLLNESRANHARTGTWVHRAACVDRDDVALDEWFPEHGDQTRLERRTGQLLRICRDDCPVRIECLHFAMDWTGFPQPLQGIWGGLTERQRVVLSKGLAHRRQATTASSPERRIA